MNATLRDFGCAGVDLQQTRKMIGNGVLKLAQRGLSLTSHAPERERLQAATQKFTEIYASNASDKTRLYPGARKMLQQFSDAGVSQALCINKPEAVTTTIIRDLGIDRYFDAVVGGDTSPHRKPHPYPLDCCLATLGVPATDCIMTGDSGVDVAVARTLRMSVGVVSYGYSRLPVHEYGADFVIDQLSALPGAIFNHAQESLRKAG